MAFVTTSSDHKLLEYYKNLELSIPSEFRRLNNPEELKMLSQTYAGCIYLMRYTPRRVFDYHKTYLKKMKKFKVIILIVLLTPGKIKGEQLLDSSLQQEWKLDLPSLEPKKTTVLSWMRMPSEFQLNKLNEIVMETTNANKAYSLSKIFSQ